MLEESDFGGVNGLCVVELPRPMAANALDPESVRKLRSALDEAVSKRVKLLAIVSTGRAFCAGLDLDHVQFAGDQGVGEHLLNVADLLDQLRGLPAVTLACVTGAAVGAGADLAVACDYRIGTPRASFRFPGSRFGLLLGTRHLARVIGHDMGRRLILENRQVGASEALEMGLLTTLTSVENCKRLIEDLSARLSKLDADTLVRVLAATRSSSTQEDRELVSESLAQSVLPHRLRAFAANARQMSSK